MFKVDFRVDLVGRIEKLKITPKDILLPLYEAVVNSFQSIEELSNKENAEIKIKVLRDRSQQVIENGDKGDSYPITGFIVKDTGVGFDDKNFESFLTSDSRYKRSKGGKGIGRFLWLKMFNNVSISSIYEENGNRKLRRFSFVLSNDPVEEVSIEECNKELLTEVKLENLKSNYANKLPRSIDKIGSKIIEHCLEYFIQKECPRVTIEDDFSMIDLKKHFLTNMYVNIEKDSFKINNNEFEICHLKLFETSSNKNIVHYCANWREVKHEHLDALIENLDGKMRDGDREFVYAAYISSKLLDDIVNDERTDFNFKIAEDSILNKNGVTKKEIDQEVAKVISSYLNAYIEPIRKEKREQIENYIKKEKPQYRPLLKYKEAELNKIKRNINPKELELELFKIQQQLQYEVKKQGEEFIKNNKVKDIKNLDEYKEKYKEYIEKENEMGKSTLAEYIIHRKIMIDLLENSMCINENEKYELESFVHNLIFPMSTISDEVNYENHNLWIIDEKLSYHYYLASDKKMKDIDVVNVDTKDRPDILVMDNPIALSNEDGKPYNALTLIEFKRPMRDEYTDAENPITQVFNYTSDIREGIKKDRKGRTIQVSSNAPFYLYIIADLTPKMIKYAKYANLTRTPDGMGFFGYNDDKDINAYIEVISYEKLLEDAKKRNRILFDKLFK